MSGIADMTWTFHCGDKNPMTGDVEICSECRAARVLDIKRPNPCPNRIEVCPIKH